MLIPCILLLQEEKTQNAIGQEQTDAMRYMVASSANIFINRLNR